MGNRAKYGYLAKNTVLFTISSFGSKLLGFILVPLYTSILSTSDFGTVDLISTTVSFMIPILTINIASAVMRFSIDDPINAGSKFKYGALVIGRASLVLMSGLVICYGLQLIPWEDYYYFFLFLLFILESYEGLVTQYLRGVDKVNVMVVSSLIATFIRLIFNVILLVYFRWGVVGYLISMVAGPLFSILYSSYYIRPITIIRRNTINVRDPLYREMNRYAFILGINAIGWTVATSLDRYILTWLKGVSENGIYSVSYKIPSVMSLLCTIFGNAWSLSAIREYNKEDKDGFFSKIYEIYSAGLTICCSALILFNIPLSKLLFAKDFFTAWKYTPLLVFAMVFNGLSMLLASVFTAVRKNGILAISTVASAIINIILNFLLIPFIGALGAAIATAVSFGATFTIRFIGTKKYINYRVNFIKDLIVYMLVMIQIVLALFANKYWYYQLLILIVIMVCNWRTLKLLFSGLYAMVKNNLRVFL